MCSSKGFLKRMLPFFATFAFGVLIASFFVGFNGRGFGRGVKRHQDIKRLMSENEELRNENLRLKNEMENHWNSPHMNDADHDEWGNPGVEFPVPIPPPPPVAPRARR